jgi:hypothetical protein
MLRHGPKLERRQMVLFRAVDIGAELFAMSAACSRAIWLDGKGESHAIELADLFCREARQRIQRSFSDINNPNDPARYRVAMNVLSNAHVWLEQGITKERDDNSRK